MRCVRVWFNKTGAIRYISHLDLMRTMTRAIRRSGIPLWYTEGFNPHPYMTFALPLSLGMESVCESMDIRIEGDVTNDDLFVSLRDAMPDGITVTAVKDPVTDPKYIALAAFDVTFHDVPDPAALADTIETLLSGEHLIVQKIGKKGHKKVVKDVDLLEHLKAYRVRREAPSALLRSAAPPKSGAPCDAAPAVQSDALHLDLVLPAGSVTNVNPALLCDEIMKHSDGYYVILRTKLMTADGKTFE